jgi:4-hydroxyproline epimerase
MKIVDSHTEGEPTRTIFDAGLDLGSGSLAEKAEVFEKNYRDFCGSVLKEPRGNDAYVGALVVDSEESDCAAGVIFFNTVQNLGMCGHGTIGLSATMAHMGLIKPGHHKFETPVGKVAINLKTPNRVSVTNIESYRLLKNVLIEIPSYGPLTGDVAWGGNWFFLVKESPIDIKLENLRELTDLSLQIRKALEIKGITGTQGAWIDHIELYGASESTEANSRSFVLVPSGSYDRSPCGTGCSAKMACLAADGAWPAGKIWIQESVIGSTYALVYEQGQNGRVIVTIEGTAFVTAQVTLIFESQDPFRLGI